MTAFSPINSAVHPNQKYPAQKLSGEQRKQLAIQVLSCNSSITDLSEQHQVSRKFLHQQSCKASDALDNVFSPQEKKTTKCFFIFL